MMASLALSSLLKAVEILNEFPDYFVEWKEHFVSKERGKRVVHYFLKDNAGESILAVVGTERSLRHMYYVVSEEFVKAYGDVSSVHAGFRWRSRREVVNWLTSMLSKQNQISKSPEDGIIFRDNAKWKLMPDYEGSYARSLRERQTDIMWSGVPWACSKQLTHYPAFFRNGISIAIHSFVYVMAEQENRYVAYLEDMYEDKKCQKKVKVRWFHHNREISGVVSLRNPHPKEVFITPHAQVISAECVDGPAVVLINGHYEKCSTIFPSDLLERMHFCSRQFKNHRLKPFKLCKLRGYYDQPIFSYFNSDFFKDEEVSSGDEVKVGEKRTISRTEHQLLEKEPLYQKLRYDIFGKRLDFQKHVGKHDLSAPIFKVNDKIELLCQDSGIRGCWFKCTILEISRRHVKIQYDDLIEEDGLGSIEEWIPACRLAIPDKLGIRYSGRPTIRPARSCQRDDVPIIAGTPVDAWWCDGWWEGFVVGGISISDSEGFQVYSPGENLLLHVAKSNLRVSRDWAGDRWVDIDINPDILDVVSSTISMDAKQSISPTKESNFDDPPLPCPEQAGAEENVECIKEKASINNEQQQNQNEEEKEKDEDTHNEKIKLVGQLTCHNARHVASPSDGHDINDDDIETGDGLRGSGDDKVIQHTTVLRGSGDDKMIQHATVEGSTAANPEEVMA